jgi:hypothetical protein
MARIARSGLPSLRIKHARKVESCPVGGLSPAVTVPSPRRKGSVPSAAAPSGGLSPALITPPGRGLSLAPAALLGVCPWHPPSRQGGLSPASAAPSEGSVPTGLRPYRLYIFLAVHQPKKILWKRIHPSCMEASTASTRRPSQ